MRVNQLLLGVVLLILSQAVYSAPLVQNVINQTNFGFVVLWHSDQSSCTLQNKSIIISPHGTLPASGGFLLEPGQPSVVFRPVYYQDPQTKEIAWLTDQEYNYQSDLVDKAYNLWLQQKISKKYRKDSQRWLHEWVGLDMSIVPHQVEMFGYLLNLSRVAVYNNRHRHVQWLSFAKGIFSKLVLELTISQDRHKGFIGTIKVLHGEGGFCSDGVIERL